MSKELYDKLTYLKSFLIANYYKHSLSAFDKERKNIESNNEYTISIKNNIDEINNEITKNEGIGKLFKIHFVIIYMIIEIIICGAILFSVIHNIYIVLIIITCLSLFLWIFTGNVRQRFLREIAVLKKKKEEKEEELSYTVNLLTLISLIK
jgi:hypothetical protein